MNQCKLFTSFKEWEQVRKGIKKKKVNICVIYYVFNWTRNFRRQFLLLLRPLFVTLFLSCLHFCLLRHFEIIRCFVKSLIATSTYFLLIYNRKTKTWKVFFWATEFGCPSRYTGLPNGLDTSLIKGPQKRPFRDKKNKTHSGTYQALI